MEGHKVFVVMHVGRLYFPQAELELVYDAATRRGTFWGKAYRVLSRDDTWLVYYGEHILGYSYIRFVHARDTAIGIVKEWVASYAA